MFRDEIIYIQDDTFGFLIDDNIQVDVKNNRIIRISSEKLGRAYNFCAVSLNAQTMKVFSYLLEHGVEREISKDELLYQVWEINNMSASTQRLWQSLKDLRTCLDMIGVPKDFIISIKGRGYKINHKSVSKLLIKNLLATSP